MSNREMLDADGFIIVDLSQGSEAKDMAVEFLQSSEVGRKYKAEYYVKERSDADFEAAVSLAQKRAKRDEISVNELTKAFTTLMEANVIPKRGEPSWTRLSTPPPPPEPEVERDVRGRPLSEAQRTWRAYRIWTDEHSCDEARQRMKVDAGYADYHRKTAEQQFEAVKSSGGAELLNATPEDPRKSGPALLEFARLYMKEPAENISRPRAGFVTLNGEQIDWPSFCELQAAAKAKGLIG
jgi:hypothetical protein